MSVLMVLKIPVAAADMERVAHEQADHLKGISQRAKDHGAIHHAFYESDDGVVVVDEWDSPESFQTFFEAEGQNIGQLMAAAGAQGEPAPPRFHRKLETGDDF
jgi:heme-degrading monooxygenase HmoA